MTRLRVYIKDEIVENVQLDICKVAGTIAGVSDKDTQRKDRDLEDCGGVGWSVSGFLNIMAPFLRMDPLQFLFF